MQLTDHKWAVITNDGHGGMDAARSLTHAEAWALAVSSVIRATVVTNAVADRLLGIDNNEGKA